MIRKKFIVALATACVFIGSAQAQQAPTTPANGQDEVQEVESQVPGQIQIVRWDMLLNQGGADAVKKVGVSVKSDSQLYEGMTCNGFEMRQAVADAITNGGVEVLGQQLGFGQSYNGDGSLQIQRGFYLNYFNNQNRNGIRMNIQFQQDLELFTRQAEDHLHVKLNVSTLNGQIIESNRSSPLSIAAAIAYEGDLAPGETVAFMAPFTTKSNKTYYQLTVWETFKASPSMAQVFQSMNNSGWWVQNGPGKLRKLAGVAALWEAQAAHMSEDVPADFQKKLDDGKVLSLVALSRPLDAMFCWWDGHGKPVSNVRNFGVNFDRDGNPAKGLWAVVEVTGTSREYRMRSPATRPMSDQFNRFPVDQPFNQSTFTQIPEGATTLDAGAIVGNWLEMAQMKLGDEKEIDGVTYKINAPNQQPRVIGGGPAMQAFTMVTLEQSAQTDALVSLSAVGADGMEAASPMGFSAVFTRQMNGSGVQRRGYQFQGLALDDVKYFRLCQRKQQWVTFDGIAGQPATPIKTDFTPDELAAALKAQQENQVQQQRQTMINAAMLSARMHGNWDAVDPDPSLPMGMLKLLFAAAGNGDEKTVRQYMTGTAGNAPPGIDAFAHYYAVSQSNWQRAVKLFGANEVLALRLSGAPLQDVSLPFLQFDWSRKDDGSWAGGPAMLRKDLSGNFYLDISAIAANQDASAQVHQASEIQDRIAKALDQPNLTIEQLRAAAKSGQ